MGEIIFSQIRNVFIYKVYMNSKIQTTKWYVYQLIDPQNSEIFYIGKGQKYRMYSHEYDVKNNKPPNRNNWNLFRRIKNILDNGLYITYEKIFHTDNELEAYEFEQSKIIEMGIDNLCNIFTGRTQMYSGDKHWNFGRKWSNEVKEKIRKSKTGQKHSEETKKTMSLKLSGRNHYLYGKKISSEVRLKMSQKHADFNGQKNPFYGKKHSDTTKKTLRDKFSDYWEITLPTGEISILQARSGVKQFISDYNIKNNTKVSFFSLFQYGRNGHGWTVRKTKK